MDDKKEKPKRPNTPTEQPKQQPNNCSPFETRAKGELTKTITHMFSAKDKNKNDSKKTSK